jgi:phasin family protein
MSTRPEEFFVQAWKQQFDTGLRIIESVFEGAEKLRESQLQAAVESHADAEATRKAIAATTDAAEIFRLQNEWMGANVRKCAAYWRSLYEVVAQTDAEVIRCACGAASPASAEGMPALGPDASNRALFNLVDNAYRQWLDATQQFYRIPAISAQAAEAQSEARAGKKAEKRAAA